MAANYSRDTAAIPGDTAAMQLRFRTCTSSSDYPYSLQLVCLLASSFARPAAALRDLVLVWSFVEPSRGPALQDLTAGLEVGLVLSQQICSIFELSQRIVRSHQEG